MYVIISFPVTLAFYSCVQNTLLICYDKQWRRQLNNGGHTHIDIFVFCTINSAQLILHDSISKEILKFSRTRIYVSPTDQADDATDKNISDNGSCEVPCPTVPVPYRSCNAPTYIIPYKYNILNHNIPHYDVV